MFSLSAEFEIKDHGMHKALLQKIESFVTVKGFSLASVCVYVTRGVQAANQK